MLSIIKTLRFRNRTQERASGQVHKSAPGTGLIVAKSSGSTLGAGIFVTNYNSNIPSPFYGNVVTAYPLNSIGDIGPGAIIADWPKTGLDYARGIAVDSRGNIYVANEATVIGGFSVTVYPPGSNGNFAPSATIGWEGKLVKHDFTRLDFPTGIALDSRRNIYVANDGGTLNSRVDSVTVYATGSSGNAKPSVIISGPDTGLRDPYGIAVDAKGTIYVANYQGGPSGLGSVTIYRPGSSGNAKPSAIIAGPGTGLHDPAGIAVDCSGDIYVANYEGGVSEAGSITIYRPGSNGNVVPGRTIAGPHTGLSQPYGIALDSNRDIYVANYEGGPSGLGSVTVYRAGNMGDAAPSRTIAGPRSGLDHPWGIATRPYQCAGLPTTLSHR